MGVDLTEGDLAKTVLRTSLPLVFSIAMQTTFSLVDAFFVGKLSPQALAAVGIGFQLTLLSVMLASSVGFGVTSVLSRFLGAREYGKAKSAAENAILSSLVLSILLALALILAAPSLVEFMGAHGSLKDESLAYITPLLIFLPVQFLGLVANGIVAAEGEMRVSMKWGVYSNILNAVLDPIFIFTFGWGVRGAAYATVISQAYGLAYLIRHLLHGITWTRPDFSGYKPSLRHIRDIYSIALPISLSNVALSVSAILNTAVAGRFGAETLAAMHIGLRLYGLLTLPSVAFSTALVSITGQCIGAGKIGRAREAVAKAGALSLAAIGALTVPVYLLAPSIISAFNSSAAVVGEGASFIRIIAVGVLATGYAQCLSSVLIAAGKGRQVLALKVLRTFIPLPISYLLSIYLGPSGVWAGITMGAFIYLAAAVYFYRSGGWDRRIP